MIMDFSQSTTSGSGVLAAKISGQSHLVNESYISENTGANFEIIFNTTDFELEQYSGCD